MRVAFFERSSELHFYEVAPDIRRPMLNDFLRARKRATLCKGGAEAVSGYMAVFQNKDYNETLVTNLVHLIAETFVSDATDGAVRDIDLNVFPDDSYLLFFMTARVPSNARVGLELKRVFGLHDLGKLSFQKSLFKDVFLNSHIPFACGARAVALLV